MFDVLQIKDSFFVTNDIETYGPYSYASEAQEKCDELNGVADDFERESDL